MSKEKTIHELAKEFPNKTYRELEKYRNADRREEAAQIPTTESQKLQEELEPIKKGTCTIGEARKDREGMNPKIKELEEALANALAVNESHQKFNGELQERVTELEEDNKKLSHQIEDRVNKMRKSGM
jgi:chromosome segregation ATPase